MNRKKLWKWSHPRTSQAIELAHIIKLRYMRAFFDAQHGLLSWLGRLGGLLICVICAVHPFITPSLSST